MLNGLTHHSDQAVNTTKKKKKSRNTPSEKKITDFRVFWYQNSGTWIFLPYAFSASL